ncbi:MAG: ATP-binding cassette domain-containing protein [Candidatus Omnitrophica bacterium]|nr:ATP-binding cassette domain-containing protein [Candidatus Omnitrophota bacterium]
MSAILEVKNLKKYYPIKRGLFYKTVGWLKAVDRVSFSLERGKTLALVGESGCGKTTLARSIAKLIELDSGEINFLGHQITNMTASQMRPLRRDLQIIFQDPFNSLDPRFTVAKIIQEGLAALHSVKSKQEILDLSKKMLDRVGLPENCLTLYPHEFSGGQRQRISIARSLILNPQLLILDEPVSSLDVSIQAQIINLLLELQERFKLTYLFIAHDLNVVRCVSDEVCVMYLGKIVERAQSKELFGNPLHPYTETLLAASPQLEVKKIKRVHIASDTKDQPRSKGCSFYSRCSFRSDGCRKKPPELREVSSGHWLSCFRSSLP